MYCVCVHVLVVIFEMLLILVCPQCEVELDTARKAVDTTTAEFYKSLDYVDANKDWKLLRCVPRRRGGEGERTGLW